jgi:hypothetical protein
MMMMLCHRYSMRSNWRGYTYVDEMRSHALVQLSQIGLYFDESKSQNPFAYYTAAITNSFTRVLNLEKRNQNLRDDLLQQAGQTPSFTRQMDDEALQRKARESKESDYHDKMEQEMKDAGYNVLSVNSSRKLRVLQTYILETRVTFVNTMMTVNALSTGLLRRPKLKDAKHAFF